MASQEDASSVDEELFKIFRQAWKRLPPDLAEFEVQAETASELSLAAELDHAPQLLTEKVAVVRRELAEKCFSADPVVARQALTYLQRLLQNSPIGDMHVTFELLDIVRLFMDKMPVSKFEGMPVNFSVALVQCLFLLIEAMRAEHLIGNLPAITEETRNAICDFAEKLSTLNVRTSEKTSGLLDETSDFLAELWFDALRELALRLKTTESKASLVATTAMDAAGAAIKLYKGDIAAGLSQLKATFHRNSLVSQGWFDQVLLLRKLISDSIADVGVFRQLKWTIESGAGKKNTVVFMKEKPRFLMHLVLGLERLILEGVTDFICIESFELLVSYAVCESSYLQFAAANVLERLSTARNRKVRSTAKVVLIVLERTILSQAEDSHIRNYATRLRQRFEFSGEDAEAHSIAKFSGFPAVINNLITHLNDGTPHKSQNLVSLASGVTSRHAAQITEAVKQLGAMGIGAETVDHFSKPDEQTGLSPVHEASKSGLRGNLEWMLQAARRKSQKDVEELVSVRDQQGKQPIHYAGSSEVLNLLLEFRAEIDAKTNGGHTVLHTIQHAHVLLEILEKHNANKKLKVQGEGFYPPLFEPRNREVAETLLQYKADLHEEFRGETVLFAAARSDNAEVCQWLRDKGVDVMKRNRRNETILFAAGPKVLPQLLQDPALVSEINVPDDAGNTPLHTCRDVEALRQLISSRADVHLLNKAGETPLAKMSGNEKLMQTLLKNKADPAVKTSMGDGIFLNAVFRGTVSEMIMLLADESARPALFAQISDSDGLDIWGFAMNNVVKLMTLLDARADPKQHNPVTWSTALSDAREPYVRTFLRRYGIEATSPTNVRWNTNLLQCWGCYADVEGLQSLIEEQVDASAVDKRGTSALRIALYQLPEHERYRGVELLLQCNADASDRQICTAFVERSSCHSTHLLDLLLQAKCNINDGDGAYGRPPVFSAIGSWDPEKHKNHLDLLLERSADIAVSDLSGRTPLHQAVETRKLQTVKKIADLCPEAVLAKDLAGETPEELANRFGLAEMANYLQSMTRRLKVKPRNKALPFAFTGQTAADEDADQVSNWRTRRSQALEQNAFLFARAGRLAEATQSLASLREGSTGKGPDEWGQTDPVTGETLLHAAIKGGSLQLVKFILEKAPFLATKKKESGQPYSDMTPLHFLSTISPQPLDAYNMASELVKCKADPFEKTFSSGPLVIPASRASNHLVLRFLLEQKVDANALDKRKTSSPLTSAKDGRTVRLLLEFRASLDPPEGADMSGNAILSTAGNGIMSLGALAEIVKQFPEGVNKAGREGDYPVHRCRHWLTLSILLEAKADVNVQNADNRTVLHNILAFSDKDTKRQTVQALLTAKVDVGAQDKMGNTPVYYNREGYVLDLLLAGRASLTHKNNKGYPTALSAALHPENLRAALTSGMPIDLKDDDSGYDLTIASLSAVDTGGKSPEALQILLDRKADISKSCSKQTKTSALHHALQGARMPVIKLVLDNLLKAGGEQLENELIKVDHNGCNVVHLACQGVGGCDLEQLYSMDNKTKSLLNKLDPAAWRLGLILEFCKQAAQMNPRIDVAKLVNSRNKDNRAPLDGLANREQISLLLEVGADPEHALAYLTQVNDLRIVDLLIQKRADINSVPRGRSKTGQESPLHRIIRSGNVPLAEEWRRRGANFQMTDSKGDSLVVYAQHVGTIRFLMDQKADINRQSPTTGNTLLHSMAEAGNTIMIGHLLNDLKAKATRNSSGESLTHAAAKKGDVDTMSFLIEQEGFDPCEQDREGQTPLHLCCREGLAHAVSYLLRARADINGADDSGDTPLLECIRGGNFALFTSLVERKADVLHRTNNDRTALHFAAGLNRHKELDRLLSFEELDVNQATLDLRQTALHMAVESHNDRAVARLLQDARVQLGLENRAGLTPIAAAAKSGNVVILKSLIESLMRSDPSSVQERLQTPFLQAVEHSQEMVVNMLVQDFGVRASSCKDGDGNHALHICARIGNSELADFLLKNWGDDVLVALEVKNTENQSAVDTAHVRDQDNVIRVFNRFLFEQGRSYANEKRKAVPTDAAADADASVGSCGHCCHQ
eukprot:TRINITY_DN38129_c0_g2_i1.p1 TRINITY_DN38129_c0_g2~~TRINITY_DN38129_c0_g2_i1.p1  ORF type:complete len:2074 (+),score=440.69 TRINITY_DN38129_c0_g2_i1:62-6283(+)